MMTTRSLQSSLWRNRYPTPDFSSRRCPRLPSTKTFWRRNAHSVHLNTCPLQSQEANNPIQKRPKTAKPPRLRRGPQRKWQHLVSFSNWLVSFQIKEQIVNSQLLNNNSKERMPLLSRQDLRSRSSLELWRRLISTLSLCSPWRGSNPAAENGWLF